MKMENFPGDDPEETITYKRKRHKAKRQVVLEAFPSEKVHHELSEE